MDVCSSGTDIINNFYILKLSAETICKYNFKLNRILGHSLVYGFCNNESNNWKKGSIMILFKLYKPFQLRKLFIQCN